MAELPFNQGILEWIVDHRFEPLTSIFLVFTFLGGEFGYILLVLTMYWVYDKKVAIRLAVVIILSSLANHVLKIIIRNPRPFVTDNTYQDNWAIAEDTMEETAQEFSTPSGHAMGSASFWSYLYSKFSSKPMLIFCGFMIFMIGISRPYLGVHYFEDVLLGWAIGLTLTYLVVKNEESFSEKWNSLNHNLRNILIVVITVAAWLIAGLTSDWDFDAQNFATIGGLITGLTIGSSYESDRINFNPQAKSIINAILRIIIGFVVTLSVFLGLDAAFAAISGDDSFLGFLLRYIRYTSLGLASTICVGWLFVKTGLSNSEKTSTE